MTNHNLSSVQNALRVLWALSEEDPGIGVTELAGRLGLAKSTAHRLLATLMADGFVRQLEDGRYALGLALWELGSRAVGRLEFREVAHPILEALRNETGETIHLALLDGCDVVYVDRFESQATLTMFRRIGFRMPAHATSSGKAILAFSSPDVVDRIVAGGLRKLGPQTLTSKKKLITALAQIRADGYVYSRDESEAGVASIGAPIFDHRRDVAGALSMAAPNQRLPEDKVSSLARKVRKAADDISRGLGYPLAPRAVHDH
ncbi:MAG: IclR family transcriptional regulator [Deltaproteobacteria bacterium]